MTTVKKLNGLFLTITVIVIIGIATTIPFMSKINSYIFTFSFLLSPIILGGWLLIKTQNSDSRWLVYFGINIILCYVLVILSVRSICWHYEYELNKYDLDGDGMLSGDEITPDMEKAMHRFTNDTGRTFAPITAMIVSPLYNGLWLVVFSSGKNIDAIQQ